MSGEGASAGQHVVLYDDACPMCTFQSRLLGWLDWSNRLRFLPLSGAEGRAEADGITREQLLEAIHCITPEGRVHRGARALRHVGFRLPLLVPLALVLWVPGVIYCAEIVYRWVSRNRQLLSRLFGCRGACEILPSKRPPEEEP